MQLRTFLPVFTGLCPVLLCISVPTSAGETIIFDGSDLGLLSPSPFNPLGVPDSLYPATSFSGNTVTITGGTIPGFAYGAVALGTESVTNNTVNLRGGSADSILGGYAASGNATGNVVNISGGQIGSNGVFGGLSDSGRASHNTVNVSGGIFLAGLIGGATGSGFATDNTVNISGNPDLARAVLFGGGTYNNSTGDLFSGNTLNIKEFTGTVGGLSNFQYYNFTLPANFQPGSTVLTVTGSFGTAELADFNSTRTSSIQSINIAEGGRPLPVGSTVTLINADNLVGAGALNDTTTQGSMGTALLYGWSLTTDDATYLNATVGSVSVNPQLKSLSEGKLAGLAFVNQGGDLLIGQGMNRAVSAGGGYGVAPFLALAGGSSRYDTGSHINVDGTSLMTGLAWNGMLDPGKLTLGAFFEAGWGNYDSHNSFNSFASVRGDGDTSYYGGGLLGRFEARWGGYAEASVRAGRVSTDFHSNDLRDGMGNRASYDSSSSYYGAHAGIGYLWKFNDAAILDLSTKYLWTHQNGDSMTVVGAPIEFNDTDSRRWRTGVRFGYGVNRYVTPYVGAAYEYEFDGRAKASTYGYSILAPELTGGTGIGELGIEIQSIADSGLSFNIGVQGYVGVREGVSGSFQLKWEF